MGVQPTPEEVAVQELAERHGLVLKRHGSGRYDFHDNELDLDVSLLGEPARWRWDLAAARSHLEREEWKADRDLYGEANEIATRRGWYLVNVPNQWIWIVSDAQGDHLAQGPFRTCVRWLREQG